MATIPLAAIAAAQKPHIRRHIERAIEALIELLDLADGDPDNEALGDEEEDSEALQGHVDETGRLVGLGNLPFGFATEDDELPETSLDPDDLVGNISDEIFFLDGSDVPPLESISTGMNRSADVSFRASSSSDRSARTTASQLAASQ